MSRVLKQQIHPYLPADLHQRFRAYCAARQVTESSVVQGALIDYLDDTRDAELILRRLDRNNRGVDRLRRDQELLFEFLGHWIQIWYAYTPELPSNERPQAQQSGRRRYEQLVDYVSRRIASGERLVHALVRESVADPAELAAAADQAAGTPVNSGR
jgi:hypothetical protein